MRSTLARRLQKLEQTYMKPTPDTRPLVLEDGTRTRVRVIDLVLLMVELNKRLYPATFKANPDPDLMERVRTSIPSNQDNMFLHTCRMWLLNPPEPKEEADDQLPNLEALRKRMHSR